MKNLDFQNEIKENPLLSFKLSGNKNFLFVGILIAFIRLFPEYKLECRERRRDAEIALKCSRKMQ